MHELNGNTSKIYCIYCKELIHSDKEGMVIKKGNAYHLECWRLLNPDFDEFGELNIDGDEYGN